MLEQVVIVLRSICVLISLSVSLLSESSANLFVIFPWEQNNLLPSPAWAGVLWAAACGSTEVLGKMASVSHPHCASPPQGLLMWGGGGGNFSHMRLSKVLNATKKLSILFEWSFVRSGYPKMWLCRMTWGSRGTFIDLFDVILSTLLNLK